MKWHERRATTSLVVLYTIIAAKGIFCAIREIFYNEFAHSVILCEFWIFDRCGNIAHTIHSALSSFLASAC